MTTTGDSNEPSFPGGFSDRNFPVDGRMSGNVETEYVALPPGQAIGDYEIVSLLRHGRLGPIYRARERRLGRDVVIEEFLPPSLAMRPHGLAVAPRSAAAAEAFARGRALLAEQARRLSGLHRAAFLARLVELVEAHGTSYLVFDLVTGLSLEDRLKADGRLAPVEAQSLLQSLLEGLRQLHEAGLIHGDVRPANIMLDMAGRPILVNFAGVQAAMAGSLPPSFALPNYAAPEQLTGGAAGPWTDIYSLAATLHAAITGSPPSYAASRLQADDRKPLVGQPTAGFSAAVLQIVDQALALEPAERPQSAMVWQSMLAKARGPQVPPVAMPVSMPGAIPAAPPPVRPSLPSPLPGLGGRAERMMFNHSRRFRLVGGIAAIAVLSLGAWFVADCWPPDPAPIAQARGRASPADLAWQHHEAEEREAALRIVRERREQEQAAAAAAEAELRKEDAARAEERAAADARAEAAALRHRHEVEQEILHRLDAEAAAKQKAEAEREAEVEQQAAATDAAVEAQQQADAADLDAARAAEAALQLSPLDRQHLQVALNALGFRVDGFAGGAHGGLAGDGAGGFDGAGVDGDFGPLTRGAIAGWQKAEGDAATGFLTAAEQQRLLRGNARIIANFDAMRDLAGAERRELALGLSPLDRQHVQVALRALGFDAGDADSLFGTRSRQMIAAWQTVYGAAPTGFLTIDQAHALLDDPAATGAIAAFDATNPILAEPREAALNLGVRDRQHVQVALRALGFATEGTDGTLGPRSRQAIAAWQKSRGRPVSGYLDAAALQALLQEAASAVASFDTAQEKVAASTAGN